MTKTLTEQWREGTLPEGYYYAGVHQYEGECDEDRFIDIVCCDQYGVSYESCYDGWDYIIRKVPDYEDVCGMESQVERLQEQLKEANELLKGLYDDSPCQFDHNGYCQEHGSTDGNYICVQGELKEYLERYGVK